jgi:D-aspartate ligase
LHQELFWGQANYDKNQKRETMKTSMQIPPEVPKSSEMHGDLKAAIVIGTHTMGLGVIRALGIMHVPIVAVYYDKRDMGYGSKYVYESYYSPHPEKNPIHFLEFLKCLGGLYPGSFLLPVSDESLAVVSRNRSELGKNFVVGCAEWEIVDKILEKKFTYEIAEQLGIPAPKTMSPRTIEEAVEYAKMIGFPCLVKPSQSHIYFAALRKKMTLVHDTSQLEKAVSEAFDLGLEVFIQEYIPGDDTYTVNYNSYFWDQQPLLEFTAQHVRKAPTNLGSPCVVVSKSIPEVVQPGRKLLMALNYNGYSCTEFKFDPRDQVYKLMEVNGRHNLSTSLAVSCQMNFPWQHYQHLMLGKAPQKLEFETGKYWIDITRDLCTAMKHPRLTWPIQHFFKSYMSRPVFAILDRRDLKPFILRFWNVAKPHRRHDPPWETIDPVHQLS